MCAQELRCPSYEGRKALTTVDLFDGPPEQLADLVPDISKGTGDHAYASWKVGYIFTAGRKLYIVCSYTGAQQTSKVILKSDKKVDSCIFRTHGKTRPAELSCR
jgi:hypothetical protein